MEADSSRFQTPSLIILLLLLFFRSARPEPYIGVNYGQVADNLPPPATTARLLQSTSISKLRLYNADPAIIQAMANTGVSLVIGASNSDIPLLASDQSAAATWLSSNVLPFHPATTISAISVGNEVLLNSNDPSLAAQLLPAMQNLHSALAAKSLADQIKITTVHPMSVLSQSYPPSSGAFDPAHADTLRSVLGFLRDTNSPFMINPYPFFAYRSDPRPETLAFCLFQPNPGRVDAGSRLTYTNMFDAQVDAVRSAVAGAGFAGVEIVVAETGWPYRGDAGEEGVGVDNARAYNGNLVAHLRSGAGTPMMPGKPVETYLFALYDEDLKPGPTSERSFGLFRVDDLSPTYDIGLSRSSQVNLSPGLPSARKPENCRPFQPGGGDCYLPSAVSSHASHPMNNLLYHVAAGVSSLLLFWCRWLSQVCY